MKPLITAEELQDRAHWQLNFLIDFYDGKWTCDEWRTVNAQINFAESVGLIGEGTAMAYRHRIGNDPREKETATPTCEK